MNVFVMFVGFDVKTVVRWGGVQAFHFGKTDFELGVGGEGQDTSRHFEGSFGSIRAILLI